VDATIVERELKIGREQAIAEGKPEQIIEKIAEGKLNRFYKDNTLLNQSFVKDSSMTVAQYLNTVNKGLTVAKFKRISVA
jgi:elongation factor Ts